MSVAAASWVLAELIRLYHVSDEKLVESCMSALSRTSIPFIETVDGEVVVGRCVKPRMEILLLLAHSGSDGLTRTEIGKMAKCSAPSVTTNLQALEADRFVHKAASKSFFIIAAGEAHLAEFLSNEPK